MKRIEATLQPTKIGLVAEAIRDIAGGFTILEEKVAVWAKQETRSRRESKKNISEVL